MKAFFRWTVRITVTLFVLLVLLVVVAALLKDAIAKSLTERNLRNNTGLDAKISRLEIGLATPTIHLDDLKLYNTEDFGGGAFLQMPELRIEYDSSWDELIRGTLHLKTVRLNLAEVHIIKNKNGKTNLDTMEKEIKKRSRQRGDKSAKPDFHIDTLYLTVGKIRITDESDPRNNDVIDIGLKEEVGKNLNSEEAINAWFQLALFRRAMADLLTKPAQSQQERWQRLVRVFGMDVWSRAMSGGQRPKQQ